MPVPLVVWGAIALGGAFVGSQIDDAIDGNSSAPPPPREPARTSYLKMGLLVGGSVLAYQGYKRLAK